MRTSVYVLGVLFCVLAQAAPLKIVITISDSNGASFGANIVFDGDKAFEFGPELSSTAVATFNLASSEWIDTESRRRVTLTQAREWANTAKARSLASMERLTDPDQRAFLQELLSPSFAVSESVDGIHLKSRFLSYTASDPLVISADVKEQIYAFDELNAFRKVMVLRQTPPFTQLEVTRLLRERGVVPGLLVTEITTPDGSVRVVTRLKLLELTPEEEAMIKQPTSPKPTVPNGRGSS